MVHVRVRGQSSQTSCFHEWEVWIRSPRASPALAQLLVLRLEHVELLGEADDDHEEQQDHQSRGAHGQTRHLELGHHRLAASALVPDVVLDVTSAERKEVSGCEDQATDKNTNNSRRAD